jgi:23S rRNA pseudouridine1911/1915/1917 synthase
MIEFYLLQPINSVEDFLIEYFHVSKNTVKFYFDKKFLKRSFGARAVLQLPLDFINHLEIFPIYEGPEIQIIFEDEIFLVLNKPANIFSHPLSYNEKNNCLSFLRQTRPEVLNINSKNYDRGLLYRLDFETSGVLVYVKNNDDYLYLRNNFKTVAKEKKYLCWVEGECKLSGKFINFFKATEEKGKKIRVSSDNIKGECMEGEIFLTPQKFSSEKNATLMEVILGQGLRHQIRAQLAFLKHPLLGDVFYGGPPSDRLYLQAQNYKLFFKDKEYSFSALSKIE